MQLPAIMKNNKGMTGMLYMAVVFMLIIGFNSATLYGAFVEVVTLTKMQQYNALDFCEVEFGIMRGTWLLKKHFQPTPYTGTYSENLTYSILDKLGAPKTVTCQISIECITPRENYNDSKYKIIATASSLKRTLIIDKMKRIWYE